jgi:hypothetical protein
MRERLQRPRRILEVASLVITLAGLFDWVTPWMAVPVFVVGAGSLALELHERRLKGTDAATVLDLRQPNVTV